ncbi:hypothetical protein SGLAM104S_10182 [Streptomyces glaucescens]
MDERPSGDHSGSMKISGSAFEDLVRAEFTPTSTFLNTASNGLLRRAVTALHEAALLRAEGRPLTSLANRPPVNAGIGPHSERQLGRRRRRWRSCSWWWSWSW